MIWACVPRVDGDPVFSALLDDAAWDEPDARGFWAIELEHCVRIEQHYVRNTPVLVTRQTDAQGNAIRSEEHTSELQSLIRISYAVFCLKKKHTYNQNNENSCNVTP